MIRRSPDLIPINFKLFKNRVYVGSPENSQDLLEYIRRKANAGTRRMVLNSDNAKYHLVDRCQIAAVISLNNQLK